MTYLGFLSVLVGHHFTFIIYIKLTVIVEGWGKIVDITVIIMMTISSLDILDF